MEDKDFIIGEQVISDDALEAVAGGAGDEQTVHQCPFCSQCFMQRIDIFDHVETYHPDEFDAWYMKWMGYVTELPENSGEES